MPQSSQDVFGTALVCCIVRMIAQVQVPSAEAVAACFLELPGWRQEWSQRGRLQGLHCIIPDSVIQGKCFQCHFSESKFKRKLHRRKAWVSSMLSNHR